MKRAKPFKGKCRIGDNSTLRKRMRAARRGFMPVREASEKELRRYPWYRRKLAAEAMAAGGARS